MSKKDLLIDNKAIYDFEYNFVVVFSWITKLTVLLFIIGVFENKPSIYLEFNFIVKVCLALFLVYRFNKYRKYKIEFTELDRKICYSSGMYILIVSFADYLTIYTNTLKAFIAPYSIPIINYFKNKVTNSNSSYQQF